ncbi:tail fiber domain-containing protein [Leclercia sp. W6]|uniref:tail fiber domain-containing protein n=1 Tax=Leclercia sp. W6 TaxID=2282310 RepID=UPI000DF3A6BD|nr:tail fiber domain-containing protein [Leclercia sp. W6]AXF59605.1 tail fiber domain-containing protein [Leclercia sp. W6]
MTKYATMNPLGSTSPYDLFDNAQNFDIALNSITAAIWQDRLGRNRTTFRGMELRFNLFIQNSGYKVIGDYEDGPLTITEYNQLIRYDGELWKLTAITNIPFTTSGTDSASWVTDSSHFVSVGDAALRQELFSNEMVNLSPLYYGATGDGATDDTAAFGSLENETAGRVIDLGGRAYAVTRPFYKNEYINGSFIIDGSKHPVEFSTASLKLKKHCGSFFTGDPNISGQTAIFPGAEGTFQGICAVTTPAGVKLYVTQRSAVADPSEPSYGNFLKGETYRIVEYSLKEDGSEMLATAFSQPLNTMGHASMLSARMEGTQLYFYSGAPNQSATDTTLGGKGFTRIRWNGSATANSDVTYYELFDQPSVADGIYKNLSKGSVVLSADGSTLAIVADDDLQGGYTALLYSLDAVLAAGTPKNVTPLSEFNFPMYRGYTLQGVTLTADSLIIYYAAPDNSAALREFDFNGNQRAMVDNIQLIKSLYTEAQYKSEVALVLEPEGSFTIAGDLYVGIREIWNAVGTVVSYNGKFYSPRAATTGNSPASSAYWWEVNDNGASTPYSATTAYTVTGVRTKNKKHIFKLGSLVEAGTTPLQGTPQLRSGPKLSNPNLDYAPDGNFGWRRWVDNLKSWLYTLHVSDTGNFRFYDTSTDSLGGAAMMIGLFDRNVGGVRSHFARIRGGESTGGNLFLYAADDATKPGAIVEYVGPNNTTSRETNQYGETVIRSNTDATKIPLRVDAQGTGDFIRGSRYDTVYFGIRASTVGTTLTSRNGNTLIFGATQDEVGGGNIALAVLSLADMALRPYADNNLDNGKVNYRWKQVFATNSSIGTSDATHKTEPRNIAQAEVIAFAAIARLPSVWRWLSKYQVEGDDARLHAGPTVQAAIAIMEANGLDWSRYSAFCYDEWENQYEPVLALRKVEKEVMVEREGFEYPEWVEVDEEYDTGEKVLVKPAGSVYSFRKEELLWWCLRAMTQQFDSLVERVARLESQLHKI